MTDIPTDWIIITEDYVEDLHKEVNRKISQGYKPLGGAFSSSYEHIEFVMGDRIITPISQFHQSMMKENTEHHFILVGDIFYTTHAGNASDHLGYGEWKYLSEVSDESNHRWLRLS